MIESSKAINSVISFHNYDLEMVIPHIDWTMFYAEWGIKQKSDENQLRLDAEKMLQDFQKNNVLDLQGVVGCFLAQVCGDDVIIDGFRFPMLRNQTASDENLALTDFISAGNPLKIFTISAGVGLKSYIDNLNAAGDRYAIGLCYMARRMGKLV